MLLSGETHMRSEDFKPVVIPEIRLDGEWFIDPLILREVAAHYPVSCQLR